MEKEQILLSRLPATSDNANPFYATNDVYVNTACSAASRQALQKWRDEDKKNMDQIINSYCSYMSGWVEYAPGTCSAGGPPPICPVNHWYKDAANARQKYKAELEKLLRTRREELKNTVCGCRAAGIRYEFQRENEGMSQEIAALVSPKIDGNGNGAKDIQLPCLDIPGKPPCPDGMQCVNGWCVTSTTEQNLRTLTKQAITDKALDILCEKVFEKLPGKLGELSQSLLKVMDNPISKALQIGMSPSTIATNYDAYMSSMGKMTAQLNEVAGLARELQRFYHNQSGARNKPYILDDIARRKNDLYLSYSAMIHSYQAIRREKELYQCSACCDEVFTAINDQLGFWYSLVMNTAYQ